MKLGILSLCLAIIGVIFAKSFDVGLTLLRRFDIPDNVLLFLGGLEFWGIGLSFVAFFLSCFAAFKGWKLRSRQQILLSTIGIVISSFVVLPTIFIIIVAILIGSNINDMIN